MAGKRQRACQRSRTGSLCRSGGADSVSKTSADYIRVKLARATACEEGNRDQWAPDAEPASILPSLTRVREAAVSRAEQKYFRDLMVSTRGDLDEARRISGLSRSRLMVFLKNMESSGLIPSRRTSTGTDRACFVQSGAPHLPALGNYILNAISMMLASPAKAWK